MKKSLLMVVAVLIVLSTAISVNATAVLSEHTSTLTRVLNQGGTVDFLIDAFDDDPPTDGIKMDWEVFPPTPADDGKITAVVFETSSPPASPTFLTIGSYPTIGYFAMPQNVIKQFTLRVKAANDAPIDKPFRIKVFYKAGVEKDIEALVTVKVLPVPEMSTSVLISTGLIGLVGLVRYRRKE